MSIELLINIREPYVAVLNIHENATEGLNSLRKRFPSMPAILAASRLVERVPQAVIVITDLSELQAQLAKLNLEEVSRGKYRTMSEE